MEDKNEKQKKKEQKTYVREKYLFILMYNLVLRMQDEIFESSEAAQ